MPGWDTSSFGRFSQSRLPDAHVHIQFVDYQGPRGQNFVLDEQLYDLGTPANAGHCGAAGRGEAKRSACGGRIYCAKRATRGAAAGGALCETRPNIGVVGEFIKFELNGIG